MKAIEKDRRRRYETANELADDVERYLAGEPVLAAPPSAAYRLRKLVRRHKGTFAAGAATVLALACGVVAFAWQAAVARGQRDRAVLAETQAAARADDLQKVADFQAQMLAQIDPAEAGALLTADVKARLEAALVQESVPGNERAARAQAFAAAWDRVNATDAATTLIDRTILAPAVAAVGEQFAAQPLVDAKLRQVLADLYGSLGLVGSALPLQERALDTRRRLLGEEHPDFLGSLNNHALLLIDAGRADEAEPLLRSGLATCRRVLGEEHLETQHFITNLGLLLARQGKLGEAEPYYRQSLVLSRRALGDEHRETILSIGNLGMLLLRQGKLTDAEPLLREALAKSRRVLDEKDPYVLAAMSNLSGVLRHAGSLDEAELLAREVLTKSRSVLGEAHPETLAKAANLAALLHERGDLAAAEPLIRDVLAKRRQTQGEDHPDTASAISWLGSLLMAQDKLAEAEPHVREALARRRRALGGEHLDTLVALSNLGVLLQRQGELAAAAAAFHQVLDRRRQALGEDHPDTLNAAISVGAVLTAQGRHADAERVLSGIEAAVRKAFHGRNAHRLGTLLVHLGRARAGTGEFANAERALLEAQSTFVAVRGEAHKETCDAMRALADMYAAWHAADPGKGRDGEAAAWRQKLDAPSSGPGAKATEPK
jgi:non-specific serine/threonine protein kinase/serine/threonine-protein kinase